MSDTIDRAKLIKDLNAVAMEHHESHIPMVEEDFRKLIHNAEPVDISEELKHYQICGYMFDELILFAEACRRQGITEADLKSFSYNVQEITYYVADKICEDVGKLMTHIK